jgi:hypothetical protein
MLGAAVDLDFGSMWTVWAALLGSAFLVLALVGLLAWLQGPPRPTAHELIHLRTEAQELGRQAAEVIAQAARAHAAAQAARARCVEAQQARELAWREHDAAQQAHATARLEATRRVPAPRPSTDPPLTQEVSRAALAAFKRGDLSVEELREVFQRTGGWDAGQDQQDQELTRARAEEHRAQRAYDLAAAGERHLCREAEIVEVAARALADEAVQASEEAHAARAAFEETRRAAKRSRLRRGRR